MPLLLPFGRTHQGQQRAGWRRRRSSGTVKQQQQPDKSSHCFVQAHLGPLLLLLLLLPLLAALQAGSASRPVSQSVSHPAGVSASGRRRRFLVISSPRLLPLMALLVGPTVRSLLCGHVCTSLLHPRLCCCCCSQDPRAQFADCSAVALARTKKCFTGSFVVLFLFLQRALPTVPISIPNPIPIALSSFARSAQRQLVANAATRPRPLKWLANEPSSAQGLKAASPARLDSERRGGRGAVMVPKPQPLLLLLGVHDYDGPYDDDGREREREAALEVEIEVEVEVELE